MEDPWFSGPPVKLAWYVKPLQWCRLGRVIIDYNLGRELGEGRTESWRMAWYYRWVLGVPLS